MTANPGRGAKNQVRIRGPKPDQILSCTSLDHLESLLGGQVADGRSAAMPDVIYTEFIFDNSVHLDVENLPDEWKESLGATDPGAVNISVAAAVTTLTDAKIKLRRQRAVARQVLQSISKVDDFKYFEKEAWDTKHNDGYRFKFLCRDSFQNKDRAQNKARSSNASGMDFNGLNYGGDDSPIPKDEKGSSSSSHHTPPSSSSVDLGLGRLPTYDCKGSIFVKFSASQSILDVVYQHMPVHREQPSIPFKRSREDGLEMDDSPMPMDIDNMPPHPHPHPPPQHYAPRFSLAAPPVLDTDDNTSAPRTKRRKRTSLKQTYKDASSSDLPDESSLNGLSTPEALEIDHPVHTTAHPRGGSSHLRKDWPASPPRSPDHPLFPDDRAFLRPSVVTRVPNLPPQFRQIARSGGYGRTQSSDADDAPLSKKKRGGPKGRVSIGGAGGGVSAAKDKDAYLPTSSAAASDSAGKKRSKSGCE